MQEFEEFWKLYPRKVAKKDARKMWARLTEDQKSKALQTISLHAKVWAVEGRQPYQIPHAATWINGERFDDELKMPSPRQTGIVEIGRSLGLEPRPGEEMHEYERRILAARH